MSDQIHELTKHFGVTWPVLLAQVVNVALVVGLFIAAARAILARGRGWEVPVWLVLAFSIPVIFPIIALVHFRKASAVRG